MGDAVASSMSAFFLQQAYIWTLANEKHHGTITQEFHPQSREPQAIILLPRNERCLIPAEFSHSPPSMQNDRHPQFFPAVRGYEPVLTTVESNLRFEANERWAHPISNALDVSLPATYLLKASQGQGH